MSRHRRTRWCTSSERSSTRGAQTLDGWRLIDKNSRATTINLTLGPGQSVLLQLDGNGAQLGNQGGNLVLRDSQGAQVDAVTYTAADANTEDRYFRFRR